MMMTKSGTPVGSEFQAVGLDWRSCVIRIVTVESVG